MTEIHTYKVIADYPMSPFSIGEEIDVIASNGIAYLINDIDIGYCEKGDVKDYPHLFEFVKVKKLL